MRPVPTAQQVELGYQFQHGHLGVVGASRFGFVILLISGYEVFIEQITAR